MRVSGSHKSSPKKRVVDWKHRRSPGYGHRTVSGYTSSRTTLGGSDRFGNSVLSIASVRRSCRSHFDGNATIATTVPTAG